MPKPVSVSFAKNNLSALLRQVRAGHAVTITDRGVPVARLVAPTTTAGIPPRFIDLAERGVVTLPEREPPDDWYAATLPRPKGERSDAAVEALLEERRSSR
jgi:antitoxin (DNA-binding transcriptional repressor) of toxin-antitoxin stability system